MTAVGCDSGTNGGGGSLSGTYRYDEPPNGWDEITFNGFNVTEQISYLGTML
jgi:hypothetical protein